MGPEANAAYQQLMRTFQPRKRPPDTHHPPPPSPNVLHTAAQVRSEAGAAYQQLAPRIFAAVERSAAQDAKYGDRLRLENYGHLAEGLAEAGGHV